MGREPSRTGSSLITKFDAISSKHSFGRAFGAFNILKFRLYKNIKSFCLNPSEKTFSYRLIVSILSSYRRNPIISSSDGMSMTENQSGSKPFKELSLYAEAALPTIFGEFLVSVYRDLQGNENAILISKGLHVGVVPFVRVHSECWTGEALGSLKCDCRDQLSLALAEIERLGSGAVIYLRQEGRGIGLGNKIKAYHLQNLGANTIEANHQLGFANDLRHFDAAAWILQDRGIHAIRINTNNPDKVRELEDKGIRIVERVPSLTVLNQHNTAYLKTKMSFLGHHLDSLFNPDK